MPMVWYGWGNWGFGWIFMIFLVLFVIRMFFGGWGYGSRRWYRRWGGYGPHWDGGTDPARAEDILRERFARGEIDESEYERLLTVLRRK